ncbi:MAG: glycosyltransferase [Betaproteobacteria bacterium]|nr:glycosyltransferase [Betaproteobacteria bacterium]
MLYRHLCRQGVNAQMLVRVMEGNDDSTIGPVTRLGKWVSMLRDKSGVALQRLFGSDDGNTLSLNVLPSRWSAKINSMDVDVVNLQWVGQETLSIRDIGRIEKPVVWTSQDLWPISGARHYEYGYDDNHTSGHRSKAHANTSGERVSVAVDKWVKRRKQHAWNRGMSIVCPSRWMADQVKLSEVARSWHISVIPNVVDTGLFKPLRKQFCREVFNINTTKKLVTCGAYNLLRDLRKGGDLFISLLDKLASHAIASDIEICIFGQAEHPGNPKLPFRTHWIPRIYDQQTLALIYNLSDIVVVPSREDNLPQVGTEAQACGIPVAGFNCTGMPDVVDHRKTGYLAKPFDMDDMAHGIGWMLESRERYGALSSEARSRAVQLWSPQVVIPQYLKTFQEAVERCNSLKGINAQSLVSSD